MTRAFRVSGSTRIRLTVGKARPIQSAPLPNEMLPTGPSSFVCLTMCSVRGSIFEQLVDLSCGGLAEADHPDIAAANGQLGGRIA